MRENSSFPLGQGSRKITFALAKEFCGIEEEPFESSEKKASLSGLLGAARMCSDEPR